MNNRLPTLKMLLDIPMNDTTYDAKLNYYLSVTEQEMLAWMNRTDFPPALENTLIQAVIKIHKGNTVSEASSAPVKSVARGDTTITYGDAQQVQGYSFLTGDMLDLMRRFKLVKFT
ncbi:hypothetical protein [Aneurinibacillus migulanus]|uniref:hypothetical protein n=1 Tax=Aneurinibacillus migulanus TaxID=47500 RepID=UPI00209FFAD7|nr:hypothetical protein [Aneurinibacillus migulanus]MCP1355084.1 hypothetical protein [Aneurinibacillus migulanus]